MTIKQQGGIFGRNPTFNNLDVDGLTNFNNTVRIARSSGTLLELYDADGGQDASKFSVTNGGRDMTIFAPQDIIFTQDGLETARFLDGGGLTFNGDTAAANALDDYEEGTFSPVFADAVSGGNLASTSNTYAQYTKVGNVVHCTISMLNINTTGLTAGNTAYIQGLPFATVSAGTSRFFPIYVRADGITSTVGIQGWILANAVTYIGLENVTTTGKANLLVSAISSGVSDLAVSFSYFTS